MPIFHISAVVIGGAPLLVVYIMGVDNFPRSMGLLAAFNAPVAMAAAPFIGNAQPVNKLNIAFMYIFPPLYMNIISMCVLGRIWYK